MEIQGTLWNFKELWKTTRNSQELQATPWNSKELQETIWSRSLWEGFWGIVIFGVEIENIGNELEIDSDLQVGY